MDAPEHHDRILVIEAHPGDRAQGLLHALNARGCVVTMAPVEVAATEAARLAPLVAILGPATGRADVRDRLRRLRDEIPHLRVVVVGPRGGVADAVSALRAHAFDYLEDPVADGSLDAMLRRARTAPDPRLATLLDSLQTLMPGLVHELRNPLSGILAGSQMLARLLRGHNKACEYAAIIQEEAQQLERFLAQLAELARLRARPMQSGELVDLPGLLGRVLDLATPACRAQRIQLVSAFDPRASSLQADGGRLMIACSELVRNAQSAMPNGGTLTVSTRRLDVDPDTGGGWIEVEIRDTGSGLSEEARHRAFDPFFSTRPRALGIGLSLVQAVIWAHGGTVRLEDAAAKGSRSVLRLPVGRAVEA